MKDKPTRALPRNAIDTVHLGQSFAEYDTMLAKYDVFVRTPALNAAIDKTNPHCFFVGRRGTGKTTITRYVEANSSDVIVIRPEIFSPSGGLLELAAFRDANQRPFKSLMSAFRRTLQDEVLFTWHFHDGVRPRDPQLARELDEYGDHDFDLRSLAFIEDLIEPLVEKRDPDWVRGIKHPKTLSRAMSETMAGQNARPYTLLIDAIDESWDGSELAVIYLAAMMHACVEINSQANHTRVLMFLRENIFERVRLIDSEFARLETCVVGLDWSSEQLLEMVERRLNAPLTAKFSLGGETWDAFVQGGRDSRSLVFDYCQSRPRDVLTYCALALDTAQSHKHRQVLVSDLMDARRRFSDSRLKDLGDEYQENYPHIKTVLEKFYGLGQRWTLSGISTLLERLIEDKVVLASCSKWIHKYRAPEQFVRLLFDIGFFGFLMPRRGHGREPQIVYRSLGPRDTTPPPIDERTDISVHPSYWDALDLQDVLITEFGQTNEFGTLGLVTELPGALSFDDYQLHLTDLNLALRDITTSEPTADVFESLVRQVIELCFFRTLSVMEGDPGSPNADFVVVNRGEAGFWDMLRHTYGAEQVGFIVKNKVELRDEDFRTANEYLRSQRGGCCLLIFRGEVRNQYVEQAREISTQKNGLLILLNDRDLRVFVRQAANGRVKDGHLQDKHDRVQRGF